PITAIRTLFRGQLVRAWAGPYQDTKLIDGATWFPYQPTTFPTPPFPEYSSGHSSFSAAGAEILKRFTHSDRFGASVTLPGGRAMKRLVGALAALLAAWALVVPAASWAAGPIAATGGGRGTVDGVHAFSDFGFSVMRSTDGFVAGHFNCLMAGSSQFPGFTLMAVRGQVTHATMGAGS